MPLTLQERADAYKAVFPDYPGSWPWVTPDGRWLNAIWLPGNDYTGNGFYGSYPKWYLPRLEALFPDIPADQWFHLYAGSLEREVGGIRVELRPPGDGVQPATVRADCRQLPFRDGVAAMQAADPPYTELDAEKYHTPPGINKPRVVRECARVAAPGGFLAWLDTSLPIYSGEVWRHFGMICVQRSAGHRTRLCSLFERKA